MDFKAFLESSSNKPIVDVYHVSPRLDLKFLRPTGFHIGVQAFAQKRAGIYVTPTFRAAVAWAVSFVLHKKHLKHKMVDLPGYKNLAIYLGRRKTSTFQRKVCSVSEEASRRRATE